MFGKKENQNTAETMIKLDMVQYDLQKQQQYICDLSTIIKDIDRRQKRGLVYFLIIFILLALIVFLVEG